MAQALVTLLGQIAAGDGWRWGLMVGLSPRRRLFHRALAELLRGTDPHAAEALTPAWELLLEERTRRGLAAHCRLVLRDRSLAGPLIRNAQALLAAGRTAHALAHGEQREASWWAREAAARLDPGGQPGAGDGTDRLTRLESLLPWSATPATRLWVQQLAEQAGWVAAPGEPACTLPVAGWHERLGAQLFDLILTPLPAADGLLGHSELALMPLAGDLTETLEAARQRLGGGLLWALRPRGETEVEILSGCSLGGAAHVGCLALAEQRRLDAGCLIVAAVDGERLVPVLHSDQKLAAALCDAGITRVVVPDVGLARAGRRRTRPGAEVRACRTVTEALGEAAARPARLNRRAFAAQVGSRVTGLASVGAGSALLTAATSARSERAGCYSLTELGTLAGTTSSAFGLNQRGHVVGHSHNGLFEEAFRWTPERGLEPLGWLDGPSAATDINDAGQVCGYTGAEFACQAFLVDPGEKLRRLHDPSRPSFSVAVAINARGQVVGRRNHACFSEAVLYDPVDGAVGLGPGAGYTAAAGINDEGLVAVVTSPTAFQDWEPRLWSAARGFWALPELGGGDCSVVAVNGRGQAIGASHNGRRREAVRWQPDGRLVRLGTLYRLPSQALGINDHGVIVGRPIGGGGLLWDPDTGLHDLGRLLDEQDGGYRLQGCKAINNAGQIAATAINPHGQWRAVLLEPRRPLPEGARPAVSAAEGLASHTLSEQPYRVSVEGEAAPSAGERYAAAVVRCFVAEEQVDHVVIPVGTERFVRGRRLNAMLFSSAPEEAWGALTVEVQGPGGWRRRQLLPAIDAVLADEVRIASFVTETSTAGEWLVTANGEAWFDAWWRRAYLSAVVEYIRPDGGRSYAVAPLGRPCRVAGRALRVLLPDDGPGCGRGRLEVQVRAARGASVWHKEIASPVPDHEERRATTGGEWAGVSPRSSRR